MGEKQRTLRGCGTFSLFEKERLCSSLMHLANSSATIRAVVNGWYKSSFIQNFNISLYFQVIFKAKIFQHRVVFVIKSLFHSGRWNFASCTIRLIYQVIAPCIYPTLTCSVFSSKPLSLMMCATFSFFSGMGYLYNAKRVVQEMLSQGSWIY